MKIVAPRWVALLLCLGFLPESSAAIAPVDLAIPAQLAPWEAWVLHRHPDRNCPFYFRDGNVRHCVWTSEIALAIQPDKASFTQQIKVYRDAWVMLPGSQEIWPAALMLDGKPGKVIERDDGPAIWLKTGEYVVKGELRWTLYPDHLQIPVGTGQLRVTIQDELQTRLNWDDQGKLWLAPGSDTKSQASTSDKVSVRLFRKILDGVPVQLMTQLQLQVSGSERELLIGQFQLANALAVTLDTELPARIEKDGRLRVQLRPGNWVIRSTARFAEPVTELMINPMDPDWPAEEVWVFEANRALRTVKITGADSIDPQQTALPEDWKHLPAFLMNKEARLKLDETHRGDPNPSPNQFQLQKTLWLDLTGDGITFKDEISGQMNQGWRLNMLPGFALGRAEINGQPQLITEDAEAGGQGLEVRQGSLALSALSRSESIRSFSATGWDQGFLNAAGELRLPPGWRLISMQGVDFVLNDWIGSWTLWDIFLVLIISLAFYRVVGPVWGLISLVTLIVIYQEQGAPVLVWLNLILLVALLRVIPENRFRKLLLWYRNLSVVALVLILIFFSVDQVRQAIYPQLEFPGLEMNQTSQPMVSSMPASATMDEMIAQDAASVQSGVAGGLASLEKDAREYQAKAVAEAARYGAPGYSVEADVPQQQDFQYDAGAQIQTGPGEPTWQWKSIPFGWNGPVEATQQVSMLLLSPTINRLLKFAQVIFILLLAYGLLFAGPKDVSFGKLKPVSLVVSALLLGGLLGSHAQPLHAEEFPPDSLLQELESRLLEPAPCLPGCASIEQGLLQVNAEQLLLRLRIHAQEQVVIPLPVFGRRHADLLVLVNGAPSKALAQSPDGQTLLALEPGTHDVNLQFGLVAQNQVDLPFSLPVHQLAVEAEQWSVSGWKRGLVPSGTLQLVKQAQQVSSQTQNGLLPDPSPTFVEIERVVRLGLEWTVETRVKRLAPAQGAIHLNVPLLNGESVTSSHVRVVNGQAQVSLAAGQSILRWESVLKQQGEIRLTAHKTQDWVEVWWLDATPIWHANVSGIPPVKPERSDGARLPKWQPWPGESIAVRVSKPKAIAGNTLTLESVRLTSHVSERSAEQVLHLNIRASQGTEYGFDLPDNARIQEIRLDGQEQALSQEGSRVQVPIQPGLQSLEVHWLESSELGWSLTTPAIDLRLPSTNIDWEMHLPANRWPLFVGGPSIGPAMLYWGMLVVLLLVAYGLGRTRQTPLKTHHWMLLVLGMSTTTILYGLIIVAWFFALARRREVKPGSSHRLFNMMQFGLVLLSIAAMAALFSTIPAGLLGTPDMQLVGNGSSQGFLHWFQDRSAAQLTGGWVWLAPMWFYRVLMLLWSLWLVFALLGWLKWGWQSFSEQGIWKFRPGIDTGKNVETVEARQEQ